MQRGLHLHRRGSDHRSGVADVKHGSGNGWRTHHAPDVMTGSLSDGASDEDNVGDSQDWFPARPI